MGRATDPDAWHRAIRLPPESYVGCRWHFVTVCTYMRERYFQEKPTALWLLRVLDVEASRYRFGVRAFWLMPDHVHLLLQGTSPDADLLEFIRIFKQKSSHRFWMRNRERLWQVSFYDHILRSSDARGDVAWYIWLNPVRAGLVKKAEEYPFSGPFMKGWDAGARPKKEWRPPVDGGAE